MASLRLTALGLTVALAAGCSSAARVSSTSTSLAQAPTTATGVAATTPATTPAPTSPAPTSPAPTTPAITSPAPTSPAPTTPAITTPAPTTSLLVTTTAPPPSTAVASAANPAAAASDLLSAWRAGDRAGAHYSDAAALDALFAQPWSPAVQDRGCTDGTEATNACTWRYSATTIIQLTVSGSRASGFRVAQVQLLS